MFEGTSSFNPDWQVSAPSVNISSFLPALWAHCAFIHKIVPQFSHQKWAKVMTKKANALWSGRWLVSSLEALWHWQKQKINTYTWLQNSSYSKINNINLIGLSSKWWCFSVSDMFTGHNSRLVFILLEVLCIGYVTAYENSITSMLECSHKPSSSTHSKPRTRCIRCFF